MVGILLMPFGLLFLLSVLFYIPQIQDWAVRLASEYASSATGMKVQIGYFRIVFPLNIRLEQALITEQQTGDTLIWARHITTDIKYRKLFRGELMVDGVEFSDIRFNSKDLIAGTSVLAHVGEAYISARNVNLKSQRVEAEQVRLRDTQVDICLTDTLPPDTTVSEPINWVLALDKAEILDSNFRLVLAAASDTVDSVFICSDLKRVFANRVNVDLGKGLYSVVQAGLLSDQVSYRSGAFVENYVGFNPDDIQIRDVHLKLDSIYFDQQNLGLNLNIVEAGLCEQSGLAVRSLSGKIALDSAGVSTPALQMTTADSRLALSGKFSWGESLFYTPGSLGIHLDMMLGKQDVMLFLSGMPNSFVRKYPNQPLRLQAIADGSLDSVCLNLLNVELPTALRLEVKGEAKHILDPKKIFADLEVTGKTDNLDFVKTFLPKETSERINLPQIALKGRLSVDQDAYQAQLAVNESAGELKLKASYNAKTTAYNIRAFLDSLDVHHFLPYDSLGLLSVRVQASGAGTDIFSPYTQGQLKAQVVKLAYADMNLDCIEATASLKNGKALFSLSSDNELLQMNLDAEGLLNRKQMSAALDLQVEQVDLHALNISSTPLTAGVDLHLEGRSDWDVSHALQTSMTGLTFTARDSTFHTKDLWLAVNTEPDSVFAYLGTGDLFLAVRTGMGYEGLIQVADSLSSELTRQINARHIITRQLCDFLPPVQLDLNTGRDNPVANYLRTSGIDYNHLEMSLSSHPETGLNTQARVYRINNGALDVDTVDVLLEMDTTQLNLAAKAMNSYQKDPRKNRTLSGKTPFEMTLTAQAGHNAAQFLLLFKDDRLLEALRLGMNARLDSMGICVQLQPENPILAYRKFTLNKDNHILLHRDSTIEANLSLMADDGTALSLYSAPADSIRKQDLTFSISRLNLDELTALIPDGPRIGGRMGADIHVLYEADKLTAIADVMTDSLSFDGAPLGQMGVNLAYLPEADSTHYIEGSISRNAQEVALLSGKYLTASDNEEGVIEAQLDLTRFPLAVANGFLPQGLATLFGYASGMIALEGTTSKPDINGSVQLDSVRINVPEYSLALRVDGQKIELKENKVRLDNFEIYSTGKTPLVASGSVDLSNFEQPNLTMNLIARNYELINAPRTQKASAYGKVYVDLDANLKGDLQNIVLGGNLNVLGSTNVTYVLRDSPLSVDDQLAELVTFEDFSDTVAIASLKEKPRPTNILMNVQLNIAQAAQVHCMLSEDLSNYIDLEGGGTLIMGYTPQNGLQLNGRYEVISGEMRYSLPVIPLKTFTIRSGSYVEFTGNPMNPRLNLAATERVRASVTENDQPRTVTFEAGVSISRTLEDMGLEFTLEAPEDLTLQNQLATMSAEQRGRLAVTMLATGMYLSNDNMNSFSTQNALNAYLQSEINQIAGKALRSIDLSIGMENNTDQTGSSRTDYSFQFAKRFWGNRISLIVGGKVSTGNDVENTGESLIDNISIEYRLDNGATRYIRLYYDKSYESLLEGEITEVGAGLVLRRKTARLGELFLFRNESKKKKGSEKISEK